MTIGQTIQTQRFKTSLKVRGVLIRLYPNGPQFQALVQPVTPEPEEYAISKEVRTFSKVFILRSDLLAANVTPGIGSEFANLSTGESYRVGAVDDNAIDVRVAYHCETTTSI